MNQGRTGASAVLLPGGKVLITGGADGNGIPQALTEVLDPASGGFAAAAPMNVARANHAAIVLNNGDVLVTGGLTTGGGYADTAEIFSAQTGTWTVIEGSLGAGLAKHAMAILPDGNVLIVGGESTTGSVGNLLLFRVSDASFTPIGSLITARTNAVAAATPDGRVLIAGGTDINGSVLSSTELFTYSADTMTGAVAAGPALTYPRTNATATTTYDGVAVIGGSNGNADLGSAEIFSQWTNAFRVVNGATPRSGHIAAFLPNNGSILAMGGTGATAVDLLQPWGNNIAGAFIPGAPSAVDHNGGFAAPATIGTLLAAGGTGASANAAEVFWFPTISTDQPDYAPGTPVVMMGLGFKPGETVNLFLREYVNQMLVNPPDYSVMADQTGSFTFRDYAPTPADVGGRYHLTAVGASSGYQAQTIFRDAGSANLIVTASPLVAIGGSYNLAYTNNGGNARNATQATSATNSTGTQANSAFTISSIGTHNGCSWIASSAGLSSSTTGGGSAAVSGTSVIGTEANNQETLTLTLIFSGCTTATTLTSSVNPSAYGQSVTLTATLKASGSTISTMSGETVTFKDGSVVLGAGTLNAAGQATFTTSPTQLAAGSHSITAVYGGDSSFSGNTSTVLTQSVNQAILTITGITAKDKVYDGTTAASLTTSGAAASGVASGDTVTLNAAAATGTFVNRNAGSAKSVTISGITFTCSNAAGNCTGNYTLTQPTATASITQKALTYAGLSSPATKIYDGTTTATVSGTAALQTAEATGTGTTADGKPYSVDSVTLTGTPTGTYNSKDVVSATTVTFGGLSITGLGSTNYALTALTQPATITAKTVTVSGITASNKTYNRTTAATVNTAGATLNGVVPADSANVTLNVIGATGTFDSSNAGVGINVTVSGLVLTGTAAADYQLPTPQVTTTATINKADASVTPNAASKTYGAADPTLTGTLSGFLAGDNVTAAYARTAGETVAGGPYTISATLSPSGVLGNYNITYNTGSFSINRADASVTPNATNKTYGTADPALSGSLLGFLPADNVVATYSRTTGETVVGGPYIISAVLTPASVLGNYNITYNTASFTISRANASVTPNTASKTYGTADPALTGVLSGFVPGDNVVATYSRTAGETVGGGPYTIIATLSPAAVLSNYNISSSTALFTITPATLTLSVSGNGGVYNGSAYLASCSVSGGLVSGDQVDLALTYSPSTPVNVGAYTATCASSGNSNYQAAMANGMIVITPAPLTISAVDQSMSFGGATPTFSPSFSGFQGSDNASAVSGLVLAAYTDSSLGATITNFQSLKAGTYPIVASGATAANYLITYANGTLTVNKAILTGSITIAPADPTTVAYGQPATATVYLNSYNIGGIDLLQSHNDPVDPNNPKNPLPPSMTVYLVPAGGSPIQAIKFGTSTAVPTYDNTINTVGTTKTGWTTTVTGNAPPPGTYQALVFGDDPGDHSLSSLNLADVGYFYPDTDDIQYPTLTSNQLDVVPATLTISAKDQTKTYGETFAFQGTEFTASGLVNSDTVTSVSLSSKGAGASAGVVGSPYDITPSAAQGTGLNNYTIDYVNGKLSVTPATASVTVTPYSVTYDGKQHTATVAATGVGGADLAADVNLSGTTHTAAGSYATDAWSFHDPNGNYSDAGGTVSDSIGKASAVVVVTPYKVTYNGHSHTATVTSITGVNDEADTIVGTVDVSHTTHTGASIYAADYWTFAGGGNYNDIAATTITDTINKANATITVTPYTVTYDGQAHTATATIAGVNSETDATVGSVDLTNTTHTNAASYATDTWKFTGGANYNDIAATTITDTINKADATVTVTPYTANYDGQPHTATATVAGVNSESGATVGSVDLSNTTHTNAGSYSTDTWTFTGGANYNNIAATTITDTINKANATVVVAPYTVTYDGDPHTAVATSITGVNGETGMIVGSLDASNTTHTNAGTYSMDSWSFKGGLNYKDIGATTITDVINKADASLKVTPYVVTYDGDPHTATGTAVGVKSEDLRALLTLSGTTHTDAGDYLNDPWSFAGNGNYNSATGTVTDQINKANATITVTQYSVIYDGNTHSASGTAIGVKGESLAGLDLSGTTHTSAGNNTDQWTFTDSTGNYNNANGTANDVIAKADATVSIAAYHVTYDGDAHTATGFVMGVKGESLSGLNLTATTHTDANNYTDNWIFTDSTGNYKDASGTAEDVISKATATVNVVPYAVTYDGNAHSAGGTAKGVKGEDLTALLSLSGTTHTNAGDYSADSWSFAGNTNYISGVGRVHDQISKADAKIVVTPYSVTYDGNAHTATATAVGVTNEELSSLLTLTGTTHTGAGDYPNDGWSFAGNGNYNAASGTAHDQIGKANANIVVTPYNVTYDGSAHTATSTVTGAKGEALSGLDLSSTSHTNAGSFTDNWIFTDSTGNYSNSSGSVNDSISKANASITVAKYNATYDGKAHTATGSAAGVKGEILAGLDLSGTTHTDARSYTDSWIFTDSTGNYNNASGSLNDVIGQAALSVTADNKSMTLNAALPTFTVSYSGFVNGETSGVLGGNLSCTTTANGKTIGSFPINCSGQTSANYQIKYNPGTLTVNYLSGGACYGDAGHQILQPINANGTSVFNAKSTSPAKFRVCDANGVSIGTPGVVAKFVLYQVLIGTLANTVNEAVDSTTPDAAFRWDPSAQQWIFNIDNKGLQGANRTYNFVITLNDSSTIPFSYGLK